MVATPQLTYDQVTPQQRRNRIIFTISEKKARVFFLLFRSFRNSIILFLFGFSNVFLFYHFLQKFYNSHNEQCCIARIIFFHDIHVTCSKHHEWVDRMAVRGGWRPSLGLIAISVALENWTYQCNKYGYFKHQSLWQPCSCTLTHLEN